jgi:NADH-quinone oxidoreductase subunit H
MIVIASMAVTLFWGGWLPPFDLYLPLIPEAIQGLFWFCLKVLIFLYFYLWFRASWPRYRYDQLMNVGWRVLMPIAIANVIVTAILALLIRGSS